MPQEDGLRWVQAIDPNVFSWIPRGLYKQIEGLDESQIMALMRYGRRTMNRLKMNSDELVLVPNELVHIAVLVDAHNKIRGFVWAEFDIVECLIFVQAASVEKSLQGSMRESITDYLFNLKVDPKFNRIRMATTHPRAYERSGWKKTPQTLMEITRDEFYRADSEQSDEALEPVLAE